MVLGLPESLFAVGASCNMAPKPMTKSEIKPGEEYAFREKRQASLPFQRVKVLEHIRGNKWKAQWVDPNPGLVDYIESNQLIVPWKEQRAFLKEEEQKERIRQYNMEHGYEPESPITSAVEQVFESVGDGISFYRGDFSGSADAIDRVRVRAGVETGKSSYVSYVDRQKKLHLPFDEALDLARKFCAAEPQSVLAGVEATEREWEQDARTPGKEHIISLLTEYRASWAIIRQWTGHDPAVAAREAHIKSLERLVWDAIYALQKAGLDSEANRLRRAIQRE